MGNQTELIERRGMARYQGRLPVELAEGTGWTRDFNAQGVYFETDRVLSDRETIEFFIPLEHSMGEPVRILCRGKVVRVEPGKG
jgi:hypothetical protein